MHKALTGSATTAIVTLMGLLAAAPAAAADYSFSYGITTGTPTPTVYASGIISTGASCGNGCFYVTNVTGQNRGSAITGYDFFADYGDQMFYPNNASMRVSGSGLTYQVGGTSYNIYATGGGYNEFHYDTATDAQIGSSAFASFFTVSPATAAVPEPATWAMMVGGFALAGRALRRRRTARTALA